MKPPTVQKYIDIHKTYRNNLILAPTGNLGISRECMPQIDFKVRDEFINFLKSKGIIVRNIRVPAKSLKMAQGEYNRDKTGDMISNSVVITNDRPIFISKDGYILDGNHRFIAHINQPTASKYITCTELGLDILDLLKVAHQCPCVRYRGYSESVVL